MSMRFRVPLVACPPVLPALPPLLFLHFGLTKAEGEE